MKYRLFILILILVLGQSCATQPAPEITATDHPLLSTALSPVPSSLFSTPENTQEPTATPTLPDITPVSANQPCVTGSTPPPLSVEAYPDFSQAVLTQLNSGATVKELDEKLYSTGVANQPVAVAEADFTGDSRPDIVVSIFNPDSKNNPPGGDLFIFICQGDHYELGYKRDSRQAWGAPGIRAAQDLNADGISELVTSEVTCGAHTCFEAVQILGWDGQEFRELLEGDSSDLPSPTLEVTDSNGDGIFDIQVTGGGIQSVGAGPQRSTTRIWTYNPESGTWQTAGDTPGLSNYRIHVLHDAEAAAQRGDLPTALTLYQRVVSDTTLDGWIDPEGEWSNLAAYARYKMMVIYALQGQMDWAQVALNELRSNYAEGSSQRSFVEMAEVFYSVFTEKGVSAGCKASQEFAAAHAGAVLSVLGPNTFGYGNPEVKPEDVCPW